MKTLAQWLDAYGESHRNPINRTVHHICVPAIMFSLLGLLWLLPLPFGGLLPDYLNHLAVVLVCLAGAFYIWLSWRIAIGAILMSVLMLWGVWMVDNLAWPLFELSLLVFVLAWIGQFIGHAIEGRRPSFAEDIRFLLIGPLWVVAHAYAVLEIPVDGHTGN